MKKTSLLSALIAFSVIGASLSTAVNAQQAGGRSDKGGGSTAGSGPSGGGSSGNFNSNFDNGSVWAVLPPQDCQHNPRYCKRPVVIASVVAEIPAPKCQLERMVQVATDSFGEPIFRRIRDCDRRYVR